MLIRPEYTTVRDDRPEDWSRARKWRRRFWLANLVWLALLLLTLFRR